MFFIPVLLAVEQAVLLLQSGDTACAAGCRAGSIVVAKW